MENVQSFTNKRRITPQQWKDLPIGDRCRIGSTSITNLIGRVEQHGKVAIELAIPPYRNDADCLSLMIYNDRERLQITKELSAADVRKLASALTEYADAWDALPKNDHGAAVVDFRSDADRDRVLKK